MEATAKPDPALPKVDLVSPLLAAAMSHPTRIGVMSALRRGPASSRQMAAAIDEPLNNVTYHVKQLRELGCIELDRTERRAGGRVIERFYRATTQTYLDDDAWAALGDQERLSLIWSVMRMISADVTAAMAGGTFFDDYDTHLTRSPMTVDEAGWGEITGLLARMTEGLFEIEERVKERCADTGVQPTIHAKVEMLQFRSPS